MFYQNLNRFGDDIAVYHDEGETSYAQLDQLVQAYKKHFTADKQLVFLKAANDLNSLIAYLACLQSCQCTMLLPEDISEEKLQSLISAYQPNILISEGNLVYLHSTRQAIAKECALLLSTSGTTGAAKQVALSYQNLSANAASICEYLPILSTDKALQTLPFYYSYGLSVINTHLLKGAAVVFTPFSFTQRQWWELFDRLQITSFSGVPHSYEMLLRLRLTQKALPSLRYFTQAGGALAVDKVCQLAEFARASNKQFFVMYGQTEATARMAFLSPDKVLQKPASIGHAIPGGSFIIQDPQGNEIDRENCQGELVYRGANIMLGYARCVADLQSFTPLGCLATGDIAVRDEEGDYYIKGRISRFLKIFGQRLSLDNLEQLLVQRGFESYCCGTDDKLVVAVTQGPTASVLKKQLSELLKLHPSVIDVYFVEKLPINSNGKRDYQAIMALAGLL